jgi:hypothetical protein
MVMKIAEGRIISGDCLYAFVLGLARIAMIGWVITHPEKTTVFSSPLFRREGLGESSVLS